jgi:hypothetical protein
MTRYHGGENTLAGIYWGVNRRRLITIRRNGDTLPGGSRDHYFEIPVSVMVILGPIAGAAYVIALPVFGIGMLIYFGIKKLFMTLLDAVAPIGSQGEEAEE